jgi:hypothetical protein
VYKIEYKSDDSITKLHLLGALEKPEIEQLMKELYNNLSDNKILLLTDARNANYGFNVDDLEGLEDVTDKYYKAEVIVYEAIIINTPKETAMTTLFNLRERKNHIVKIFSTESAAYNWLLNQNVSVTSGKVIISKTDSEYNIDIDVMTKPYTEIINKSDKALKGHFTGTLKYYDKSPFVKK